MRRATPFIDRHHPVGDASSLRAHFTVTKHGERVPIATFRAPDKWIRSIVRQSLDFSLPPVTCERSSINVFDWLLPLIRHDSIDSDEAFDMAVERHFSETRSAADVPSRNTTTFSEFARDHARNSNKTRIGVITLPGSGSNYMPPIGVDARRAIQTAIESVSKQYLATDSDVGRLGIALAAYYLILAIHPFSDGNGRTSRFYFACLIRNLKTLNTPSLLLALCLLHRNNSVNFYVASQLARSGDFSFFMKSYSDSISAAATTFDSELTKLSFWANSNDNPGADAIKEVLFAIRRKVALQAY